MKSSKAASVAALLMILSLAGTSFSRQAIRPPGGIGPRVVAPLVSYDFGDIHRGEIISFIFTVRNEGDEDLTLTDHKSSCGCTLVGTDGVIPPGKGGRVYAELNTALALGSAIKTISLKTNDPRIESLTFSLVANILSNPDGTQIPGTVLRPGKHIGPFFVGPHTHAGVSVAEPSRLRVAFDISVERGSARLLDIEGADRFESARIESLEEPKKFRIVLEGFRDQKPGRHTVPLEVRSDSQILAAIPLTVLVNVLPAGR